MSELVLLTSDCWFLVQGVFPQKHTKEPWRIEGSFAVEMGDIFLAKGTIEVKTKRWEDTVG